jgi:zinc protease
MNITRVLAVISLVASQIGGQAPSSPAKVATSAIPKTWKDIKFPPLNSIKVPEVTRFELSNGMKVLLVEDHELPTFNASARIKAGDRFDPADKVGLMGILGQVIRTGGSTSTSGDYLDRLLDSKAMGVESSMSTSYGSLGASGLKENSAELLSLMSELLQNPALPQDKIDLAKTELRDGISRRNDDVGGIAARVGDQIVYGKTSPYARTAEYDTVDSISRDDLVTAHRRFYQPESVILAIWGDFKVAEMKALVEKAFGGWKRGGNPIPSAPDLGPDAGKARGVFTVDKTDSEQAKIAFVRLGNKYSDPDFFPLVVANQILGGGFTSRLFNSVRTKEGLAYDPFASWSASFDIAGDFTAQAGTKNETAIKATKLIQQVLSEMGTNPVTDKELQGAKDVILKGFAFDFDSAAKVVSRLANYEYFGYPADFLQKYRDNIAKVTKEDVQRVSKQYLDPKDMAVTIVGNLSKLDEKPESLGLPVTPVDISIPKAKSQQVSDATPENKEKGRALLAKAREVHGGTALDSIRLLKETGTVRIQGQIEGTMESVLQNDGKQFAKLSVMGQEILQAFDGKGAWIKMQGQVQTPPGGDDSPQALVRHPAFLLSKPVFDRVKTQALGIVKFEGQDAESVLVTDPETKAEFKLMLDPKTGVLVGMDAELPMMGPKTQVNVVMSEIKEVGGVKLPMTSKVLKGGRPLMESMIKDVQLNPTIDASIFEKPRQ